MLSLMQTKNGWGQDDDDDKTNAKQVRSYHIFNIDLHNIIIIVDASTIPPRSEKDMDFLKRNKPVSTCVETFILHCILSFFPNRSRVSPPNSEIAFATTTYRCLPSWTMNGNNIVAPKE